MKRLAVLGLAIGALSVAGLTYVAESRSAVPPNVGFVFGGGDAVILNHNRTFSIGVANGRGTLVRSAMVVHITCERVVVNAAVLGGRFNGEPAGQYLEIEVVDNGLPVNGPAGDQITPFVVLAGRPPLVCSTPIQFNLIRGGPWPLSNVAHGDIVVRP